MMTSSNSLQSTVALALAMTLTACSSDDRKRAGQMTSYSANGSPSSVPQLFTIPQDQITPENFQSVKTLEAMIAGQLQPEAAA